MQKILTLTSLAAITTLCGLNSCQQNYTGLKPTALQEYIAKVDAQATVKTLHHEQEAKLAHQHQAQAHKHHSSQTAVPITTELRTIPGHVNNNLFDSSGNLVFSGAPISQEQLVHINSNGSTTVVEDFMSDPQGSYIGFTPQAVYHINKGTGQTHKIAR